jgi:hypothetical protein
VPPDLRPVTVCAYANITYTTPLLANTTYTWNVTGGYNYKQYRSTIGVQWGASATGTITLTATNVSGCDSTVSSGVTIRPNTHTCNGRTEYGVYANYFDLSLQATTTNAISWNVSGGQILGANNARQHYCTLDYGRNRSCVCDRNTQAGL